MRYLKYASLAVLVVAAAGCARNPYRKLQMAESAIGSGSIRKLQFGRELYRCVVDGGFLFKKYHLSGVLLFKTFEDGTQRVVFQNELGISFFNFKWDRQDSFSVTSVMPQLDRPAIIKTLRTDFELLLRKNLDTASARLVGSGNSSAVMLKKNAGSVWYATDGKMIAYGGKALVTTIAIDSPCNAKSLPQKLRIIHHKARFTIDLNRIPPDEN